MYNSYFLLLKKEKQHQMVRLNHYPNHQLGHYLVVNFTQEIIAIIYLFINY